MKGRVTYDGQRRFVRIGRDGKNRYCLFYYGFVMREGGASYFRNMIAGGLTKLAARALLRTLAEVK